MNLRTVARTNDFLAEGGEMGVLTRAFDWAQTPIGPARTWPQSLRTALRILLNSNHPMFIWWGPELIQFYNDAYRRTMGPERHPSALGQRGRECWEEIWPIIGPQIEQVMNGGGATWNEDQLVPVTRHGKREKVWWTYGYSPIDDDGRVGGVLVVCQDVTEQHTTMAALRQREQELARVQQIGKIGGLEVDLQRGFRNRRSPEFLQIHGLPPNAQWETHEDWLARIHPDDRAAAEQNFIDTINSEARDYTAQYRIVRPNDGETRWISVKAVIERDVAGRGLRLVGAHLDVTDQVAAAAALRDRDLQFRLLADAVPNQVWTAAPDGSLNWFNLNVYDYTGTAPGDLDGDRWGRVVHPDDLPASIAAWTKAIEDGDLYQAEFRLRHFDGNYRWFLARAVAARDDSGHITRWIGTNTDINDQRLASDEMARVNASLEERITQRTRERDRVWNVSQDLLVVTDHSGVYCSANPAWTCVLGWSEAELIGKSSTWMVHPDDEQLTRSEFALLADSKMPRRFENRLRHRDGSYRWLSWTAVPDDLSIYAVARDVTSEKVAAEALKATEEALRQSHKMEAVGQLTGGIAHDFNNLLTGIVGSLDLLQARLNKGRTDNTDRYIAAAMTSANRAAALTHRLLAFARRQPLDPKSVNANQLIVSLEELLRRTIGESIALNIVTSADLWLTLCDPNQLESAILNLAINARDAMSEGGRLRIETANVDLDKCAVVPEPAASPGQYICISVTDTGQGMTPDVVVRAFDPFFTTKPLGQGTGLGLSMIYGFARQSNGHATISSNPGKGTTVKLYLPRHRGAADHDPAHDDNGASTSGSCGETVLVVEDEPVVRSVIVEMLRDQGYQVLQASDGPSGLGVLQSTERIDLLITDIGLPGLNGRQLADQARDHRPGLRILLITGYAENAAIAQGFLQPGMQMMTKPFAVDRLAGRIREMMVG